MAIPGFAGGGRVSRGIGGVRFGVLFLLRSVLSNRGDLAVGLAVPPLFSISQSSCRIPTPLLFPPILVLMTDRFTTEISTYFPSVFS